MVLLVLSFEVVISALLLVLLQVSIMPLFLPTIQCDVAPCNLHVKGGRFSLPHVCTVPSVANGRGKTGVQQRNVGAPKTPENITTNLSRSCSFVDLENSKHMQG